jgi:hypothetical protein
LSSHNNKIKSAKQLDIEQRRRYVASLLSKGATQSEIAEMCGVDQSTVSDDLKALKLMSQQFVYDLAKGDLGFCYKQCLDGLDEAKREAWKIYYGYEKSFSALNHRLTALKIVIQAEVEKFKLLNGGPNVLAVNKMSERIDHIEQSVQEANR